MITFFYVAVFDVSYFPPKDDVQMKVNWREGKKDKPDIAVSMFPGKYFDDDSFGQIHTCHESCNFIQMIFYDQS